MTARNRLGSEGPLKGVPEHDGVLGSGFSLGIWAGVPIRAHWSVGFTVAVFAVLVSAQELPAASGGHSALAYWFAGLLTTLVFFVTLLAHEFAHAEVARHYGLRVRSITLWMLGGLTDLDGEMPSPRADAAVAAAGPAVSLGTGAGCVAISYWVGGGGLFASAVGWLAAVSILLGVFNLLPATPLDGGRLLRALLWWHYRDRSRAAIGASRAGRALGLVLLVVGLMELLVGAVEGLWLSLVGALILSSSQGERDAAYADQLGNLRVRDAMTPSPMVAANWWTVQQFLGQVTSATNTQSAYPLVDFAGEVSGAITVRDLQRVARGRRSETRLRELVRSAPANIVAPDTLLASVWPAQPGSGTAIVVDDGHVVGVVTAADLARAVRLVAARRQSCPGTGSKPAG